MQATQTAGTVETTATPNRNAQAIAAAPLCKRCNVAPVATDGAKQEFCKPCRTIHFAELDEAKKAAVIAARDAAQEFAGQIAAALNTRDDAAKQPGADQWTTQTHEYEGCTGKTFEVYITRGPVIEKWYGETPHTGEALRVYRDGYKRKMISTPYFPGLNDYKYNRDSIAESIKSAETKTPDQIAADIARRLLPSLREELARRLQKYADDNQTKNDVQANAARVEAAAGRALYRCANQDKDGSEVKYDLNVPGCYGEARISDSWSEFRLRGLNAEQAEAVAALIATFRTDSK